MVKLTKYTLCNKCTLRRYCVYFTLSGLSALKVGLGRYVTFLYSLAVGTCKPYVDLLSMSNGTSCDHNLNYWCAVNIQHVSMMAHSYQLHFQNFPQKMPSLCLPSTEKSQIFLCCITLDYCPILLLVQALCKYARCKYILYLTVLILFNKKCYW